MRLWVFVLIGLLAGPAFAAKKAGPEALRERPECAALAAVWVGMCDHYTGAIRSRTRFRSLAADLDQAMIGLHKVVADKVAPDSEAKALEALFRDRYGFLREYWYPETSVVMMVDVAADIQLAHVRAEMNLNWLVDSPGEPSEQPRNLERARKAAARELELLRQLREYEKKRQEITARLKADSADGTPVDWVAFGRAAAARRAEILKRYGPDADPPISAEVKRLMDYVLVLSARPAEANLSEAFGSTSHP